MEECFADFDLARVRADTPAAANQTFLLSSGASLMPSPVVEAMVAYLQLEAAIGGYAAAAREAGRLDGVYDSLARLINSSREEVALVESATVGWQMAFYSLRFSAGDRILTSSAEYGANYVAFLQIAHRTGAIIEIVPDTEAGELDVDALEAMLDERVKLIAITWVPTNGGLRNPAAAIGLVARKYGIPYLLDACQAVGQMPVDVDELCCDFLSATARKFLRGPRGAGFLFVRKNWIERLEPPMIDHFAAPWVAEDRYELRMDARRFETWENNYALRLGMEIAADYAMEIGVPCIERRCQMLSEKLRIELTEIPGVTVHDLGEDPCAIVSFSVQGVDAPDFVQLAEREKIVVGTSKPSSTLLDARRRQLPVIVRASPHYFNTVEDVDRLVAAVRRSAGRC